MKSRRKGNPMTTLTSKPIAVIMPLFAAAIAVVGTVAFPAPVHADGGCIPGDIAGQVPRKASASDMVCVSQTIADLVQQENATAADRREPNGGPYGPLTCKQGWVWREAFDGDGVCVTPQRRQETWQENANAGVGPTGGLTPQTTSTGSAAADPALLSAINDARLHPEKYPPNGNTAGAAMTACPSGFNNSAGLTGTATAHNNFLASMSLTQANKDPHVTPAGGHQWDVVLSAAWPRPPNRDTPHSACQTGTHPRSLTILHVRRFLGQTPRSWKWSLVNTLPSTRT